MATKRYNLGPMGDEALEAWATGAGPRALVVLMPGAMEIGEDDLVREAAEARCRARGFRDRLGRHLLVRRYDAAGSEADTMRFFGIPGRVAEVANTFAGVDAIELSGWEDGDLSCVRWRMLMAYLGWARETDFVLVVRSDRCGHRERVFKEIAGCGIPFVGVVELHYPTGAQLASAFVEAAGEEFGEQEEDIAERIDQQRARGFRPTYAFSRWLAEDAMEKVAGGLPPHDATSFSTAPIPMPRVSGPWARPLGRER